jgi:HD-GYP domain-containing protein (c-di-GMP phosphodiesterase class II)
MHPANVLDPEEGTYEELLAQWGDLEQALALLLNSPSAAQEFARKVLQLDRWMQDLLAQDTDTGLYLLFQMAATSTAGYSSAHALVCAVLCDVCATEMKLPRHHRDALVHAAMTMNIAMTRLQDQLALQAGRPSAEQQAVVNQHADRGAALLLRLGVHDPLWIDIVAQHHDTRADDDAPAVAAGLAQVLGVIDRYAALVSPRQSRAGRSVTESMRLLMDAAREEQRAVGEALVRAAGASPPGTFVRLKNDEVAVVLRRGARPHEPWVAVLLDARSEPLPEPRLKNTAREGNQVVLALAHNVVSLSLNHRVMVGLSQSVSQAMHAGL